MCRQNLVGRAGSLTNQPIIARRGGDFACWVTRPQASEAPTKEFLAQGAGRPSRLYTPRCSTCGKTVSGELLPTETRHSPNTLKSAEFARRFDFAPRTSAATARRHRTTTLRLLFLDSDYEPKTGFTKAVAALRLPIRTEFRRVFLVQTSDNDTQGETPCSIS